MGSSVIKQQSTGLATTTQPGLVSTAAQTFAGDKTFNGNIFTPNRPAFYALSSGTNRTTVAGTSLVFDGGVRFNIGNNYNSSTYRFTAPVAGLYYFWVGYFNNGAIDRVALAINGSQNTQPHALAADGVVGTAQTSGYAIYLSANDVVDVRAVYGGGTYFGGHTAWGGYLIS